MTMSEYFDKHHAPKFDNAIDMGEAKMWYMAGIADHASLLANERYSTKNERPADE